MFFLALSKLLPVFALDLARKASLLKEQLCRIFVIKNHADLSSNSSLKSLNEKIRTNVLALDLPVVYG